LIRCVAVVVPAVNEERLIGTLAGQPGLSRIAEHTEADFLAGPTCTGRLFPWRKPPDWPEPPVHPGLAAGGPTMRVYRRTAGELIADMPVDA
jgi:hypothetical protein